MYSVIFFTSLIFVPLLFVSAILTAIGLKNVKTLPIRCLVTALFLAVLATGFFAYDQLLSQPKPVSLEWLHRNIEVVEVLAAEMTYKEAIYMWFRFPNEKMPRYYIFPWDDKQAEALQKALEQKREARGEGKLTLEYPFRDYDNSLERRKPQFKFEPRERGLPLKPYEDNGKKEQHKKTKPAPRSFGV